MSKYLPLTTFLNRQKTDTVTLSFSEIERVLSRLLPKAAGDPNWWQPDAEGQPQQRALAKAGVTVTLDRSGETVRFDRIQPPAHHVPRPIQPVPAQATR